MTSTHSPESKGLARYWPFGVFGLAAPLLAVFVGRWMPFSAAVGACMFVSFAAAVWVFQRGSGRSLTAGFVSGLAAGVIGGGFAWLFPWA